MPSDFAPHRDVPPGIGQNADTRLNRASFSIDPAPPFRLDLTAWAIRRRPGNAVDVWSGDTYERVLTVGDQPVHVSVTQSGDADKPRLEVVATGVSVGAFVQHALTAALERLLGSRIDLTAFYDLASEDARLHSLAMRMRGLKPPRFPTVWEALVNGIACQQLSLNVGILLLNRLAAARGSSIITPEGARHAFPLPAELAEAEPEFVRSLGFSGAKTRAVLELAKQIATGDLDLESLEKLDTGPAISRLLELRGVGRWTAEYTLLRGLGRTDLFPGDDIGARNSLARWLSLRKPLDYGRVAHAIEKWRPYGGLIYFHLLLDGLERAGHLRLGPESGSEARTPAPCRKRRPSYQ